MPLAEIVKVNKASEILLEIKRSKFIAYAVPLTDLKSVDSWLCKFRAKQPTARHHVYAWKFYDYSTEQQYAKFSDDGEPSQTAGAPLFHVLSEAKLNNTLLVVSRIFGGILLGAGGLVRAYSKAGSMALQSASYEKLLLKEKVEFILDYSVYDSFIYACDKHNWQVLDVSYADKVTVQLAIDYPEIVNLECFLAQLCLTKLSIKKLGSMLVPITYEMNF